MTSNVGYHFASALLRLGRKSGDLGRIQSDLARVSDAVAGDRRVVYLLLHPLIPYARKEEFLKAVCETESARRLVRVLIETNNLGLLSQIARQLSEVAAKDLGMVRATVTTAADIPPVERERLRAALAAALGNRVELELKVDAGVLGGVSLRVGDRVIDNTIRTQLKMAKVRLGSS